VLVLATGLALIFLRGGFKAVPHTIHAGLGLTLLAFAAGLTLTVPALTKIKALVAAGSADQALPLVKRIAMGESIEHTCWLTTLVLMICARTLGV
jgi:hypothetical protein